MDGWVAVGWIIISSVCSLLVPSDPVKVWTDDLCFLRQKDAGLSIAGLALCCLCLLTLNLVARCIAVLCIIEDALRMQEKQ